MQELRRISRLHNQVFFELKKRCPSVALPPLYKEIFSEDCGGESSFPGGGGEHPGHHHRPHHDRPMENNFSYDFMKGSSHFNPAAPPPTNFGLPPNHNPPPQEPQTSTSRVNGATPRYPYHVSTTSDVTMRASTTRSSSTSSIGSGSGNPPLMGAPPAEEISPVMSDGKSHSSTSSADRHCIPEYPPPAQSSHSAPQPPPPGRYAGQNGQMFGALSEHNTAGAMPPTYQMSMLAQSSQQHQAPQNVMRPPEVVSSVGTITHAPL